MERSERSKKLLINFSNHPSQNWDEKQKEGWDKIVDVPFPQIPPQASEEEVKKLVSPILGKLKKLINSPADPHLFVAGDFFTSFYVIGALLNFLQHPSKLFKIKDFKLAFPSTERRVVERKEGEKVFKSSVFQFVRWRILRVRYDEFSYVISLN